MINKIIKLKNSKSSIHKIVQGVRTTLNWLVSVLIDFLFVNGFLQTKTQNDRENEHLKNFGPKMKIDHKLSGWACA